MREHVLLNFPKRLVVINYGQKLSGYLTFCNAKRHGKPLGCSYLLCQLVLHLGFISWKFVGCLLGKKNTHTPNYYDCQLGIVTRNSRHVALGRTKQYVQCRSQNFKITQANLLGWYGGMLPLNCFCRCLSMHSEGSFIQVVLKLSLIVKFSPGRVPHSPQRSYAPGGQQYDRCIFWNHRETYNNCVWICMSKLFVS